MSIILSILVFHLMQKITASMDRSEQPGRLYFGETESDTAPALPTLSIDVTVRGCPTATCSPLLFAFTIQRVSVAHNHPNPHSLDLLTSSSRKRLPMSPAFRPPLLRVSLFPIIIPQQYTVSNAHQSYSHHNHRERSSSPPRRHALFATLLTLIIPIVSIWIHCNYT